MLNKIRIENFKCFEKMEIDLHNLNVFAGINGMGKSTTIQTMLLLKQSFEQGYLQNNKICLNGNYVSLGTGKDILFRNAEKETIKINLLENDKVIEYEISYSKDANVLDILNTCDNNLLHFGGHYFEYLNAERNSPQTIYQKSNFFIDIKSQLGINGQYSAHYLYLNENKNIPWDSTFGKVKSIKEALQFWLNEISPDVKLNVQDINGTDLSKISYYYTTSSGQSDDFRPTNIGFGVSYVLPVILALIKAEPDSLLIIENPEAHLHPKGQRKIGELIALCSQSRVQIFIETHSDHILNGIRIAVKNKKIEASNIGLYFFERKIEDKKTIHIVETIKINSNGKLDHWPDGFFDEWEKALDEII